MRSGVEAGAKLGPFATDAERAAFAEQLAKAEDWLYDHLDDGKAVFEEKLAELRVLGGPIERRFREHERRPEAVASLQQSVRSLRSLAQARPKNGNASQMRALEVSCDGATRWLADMQAKQAALPKHADPVLD